MLDYSHNFPLKRKPESCGETTFINVPLHLVYCDYLSVFTTHQIMYHAFLSRHTAFTVRCTSSIQKEAH